MDLGKPVMPVPILMIVDLFLGDPKSLQGSMDGVKAGLGTVPHVIAPRPPIAIASRRGCRGGCGLGLRGVTLGLGLTTSGDECTDGLQGAALGFRVTGLRLGLITPRPCARRRGVLRVLNLPPVG
jgi:hypothetical protein